ncbi:MAG: hypothetical protein N3I86_00430 [Verrucomicrobiae bacterium]|nr:hypothetical protein [Verrucomicrobiae bacterium]
MSSPGKAQFPLPPLQCGLLSLTLAISLLGAGCKEYRGTVVDAETQRTIANATVYHDGKVARSDFRGEFSFKHFNPSKPVLARAAGYRRAWTKPTERGQLKLELQPLELRGIYLSHKALGLAEVRARVLGWLDGERLNTLVVDIKDEHGRMTFYNGAPEAGRIGAFGTVRFDDIQAFLRDMHRRNIYVVGRISVFQDALLAKHQPQWRPRSKGRGNLFWLDPFRKQVWAYNIAVAREAAAIGFDEIQFDHMRFPNERELPQAAYSRRDTDSNRTRHLAAFLARAGKELLPFNVSVSLRMPDLAAAGKPGEMAGVPESWRAPVDCLVTRVSGVEDFEAAMKAAGREGKKRLRVWLECGGQGDLPASRLWLARTAELINACEAARIGGWVLDDPSARYDDSLAVLRELISQIQ